MLDMKGEGKIDFKSFEHFQINFLHMYGELLQVKMQYNDDSKELTKQIFSKLIKAKGEIKQITVQSKLGKKTAISYFDLEDYQKARIDMPELFEWLDYPEQYVEQFLKSHGAMQKFVKMDDF